MSLTTDTGISERRKRKPQREYDQELKALVAPHVDAGLSAQDIVAAVQRQIGHDDALILHLTRPRLPGVLLERILELMRSHTGHCRRRIQRVVSDQADPASPNHMSPADFRETASSLMFSQRFAGKLLEDWTYGEIREWGERHKKQGTSMVKWGQLAINIGGLGADDARISRAKDEKRILKLLNDLNLSLKELPA